MGFNSVFKGLILILLTWTIWRVPTNGSKWQMGFNSAFKGLTLILLTWTIWRAPTNASKWRMGFNSAFKGLIHNKLTQAVPSGAQLYYFRLALQSANPGTISRTASHRVITVTFCCKRLLLETVLLHLTVVSSVPFRLTSYYEVCSCFKGVALTRNVVCLL